MSRHEFPAIGAKYAAISANLKSLCACCDNLYLGQNETPMKYLLTAIVTCALLFSMSSCYKQGFRIIVKGIGNQPPPPDSSTALLTSQTWVYDEYFDYFDSVEASLVWKRSPLVDSVNLSLNQVKFNADGTYTEITQTGTTLNGTWSYNNGEKGITVVNSEGTFKSTIQVLTSQRYEWLGSAGTYGVMVPKNQAIDTAGGRMALITAHTWVYTEYFYNFGLAVPSLVWKTNLPGALLNLGLDKVKYNTDGTYTETDQYGNIYNGTWAFTNNQTGTIVYNIQGTFSGNIELLSTDRYEWYDGVNHYGEMVPQ